MSSIELQNLSSTRDTVAQSALSSTNTLTVPKEDSPEEGVLADSSKYESSLGRVDGGFRAWSLLVAAFLADFLIWGYPNSYGVLLVAYLKDPRFNQQAHASTLLPLVGNLCTGIMCISSLVIYPTMRWYPRIRRIYTWTGTIICCASVFAASFTDSVTLLVLLQGVLFAIGGSLAYAPVISYMSEWFVKRRGLANGIVFSGAGWGSTLFPIILPRLIERYGVMKTTRGFSIAMLICLLPVLPLMKARLPETRVHGPAPRSASARQWLFNKNLWFFVSMNTLESLGHFIPMTWLPTFASSLGLSTTQSSLALTLASATAIVTGTTMGWLSDRFDVWLLALSCLVGMCSATFIIWGVLAFSLPGILAYGVAYGGAAGGWTSLWYAFVNPIAKDDPSLSTTLISFLLATRGIGNILCTPISTALQGHNSFSNSTADARAKTGFGVAGGHYSAMIAYAGSCFAAAAIVTVIGFISDRRSKSHHAAQRLH
ncbi:MFS general substrate transporter [Irpex lacteus]|nr:MFS general substrate transporter [Irpex lacteus]